MQGQPAVTARASGVCHVGDATLQRVPARVVTAG